MYAIKQPATISEQALRVIIEYIPWKRIEEEGLQKSIKNDFTLVCVWAEYHKGKGRIQKEYHHRIISLSFYMIGLYFNQNVLDNIKYPNFVFGGGYEVYLWNLFCI